MVYVKVNGNLYPASIGGKLKDAEWGGRESKTITMEGDYATIDALFPNGTAWSIVTEETVEGEVRLTEYDNHEFNIRGDLTVHGDGTCTVKMGKITELEAALNGAVTTAELDAAYAEGVNEA